MTDSAPAIPTSDARDGGVEIVGVTKTYGDAVAVDDLSLSVQPGEFLSLLGPSGCGKTTTLRMIAGFEHPDSGDIHISGRSVLGLPPYKREVNTVFQAYALFPHMTVAENVAYGLQQRRVSRAEQRERVIAALDMVQLRKFADRKPTQLSGGQQQRIALSRALINRPSVLLLDEPLAALDRQLREEMQVELKLLQSRLGTTFVFVTHDQGEALSMSDRIAVMRAGRIEQLDAPSGSTPNRHPPMSPPSSVSRTSSAALSSPQGTPSRTAPASSRAAGVRTASARDRAPSPRSARSSSASSPQAPPVPAWKAGCSASPISARSCR